MTLIELLVAIAIVGIIFALAAGALRDALDLNLKNGARQLGATLRYLHNKSVTDHVYLRMVYDFEKQSYWVEESSESFVVSKTEEAEAPVEAKEEVKGEAETPEEGTESPTEASSESTFSPSESKLLKETPLPSGVFFKDLFVSYLGEKKEQGQGYTYFFPDGFATATVIHLRDEDDEDHFSIEVAPLTGRVRLEGGYLEETQSPEGL